MAGANGRSAKTGPKKAAASERIAGSRLSPRGRGPVAALRRIDGMLDEEGQLSIKTSKVFGHRFNDDAFSPTEMRMANNGLDSAPVRTVSLRGGFRPMQTNLHVRNLMSKINGEHAVAIARENMPAVVIRKNGERYLFDGHHRVAAAMLMGRDKVQARVYRER